MNKVFLVGRLAADPEPYTTKSGISQSRVSIATQDSTSKQEAYFFPCVAWRNQANFINTYLKRGDLVAIDGKLTRRSYVNREGKNVYITEIVIDAVNSLSNKRDANSGLSVAEEPTKKVKTPTVGTESIDASFPEQVVSQTDKPETHKQENTEFKKTDVDWLDELNKE